MRSRNGLSKRALGFFSCLVALPLCAYILPSVHVEPIYMSVMLGLILGVVYLVARPLLRLLSLPLGCLTFGLSTLAIDTGIIWLLNMYLPGFTLDGPQWALLIAFILTILRCPLLR